MNQSVWYEQIDGALIEFISNKIKLNGVPAHVFVRKPEEEFIETTFPCVTIYNTGTVSHESREDFQPKSVQSRDIAGGTVTFVKTPVMYVHQYQIDFWSRYQSQMNEMLMKWLSAVDRDFNIPTLTTSGQPDFFYVLENGGVRKSDLISDKQRLFHSFITYKIYSDIDAQELETVPIILKVEVTDEDNP